MELEEDLGSALHVLEPGRDREARSVRTAMHRFTRRQPAKTSPASLLALAAIAALALLSPLTTGAALAHQRTAIHAVAPAHAAQPVTTYHVTTDVGHRGAPTAAPDGTYGLPNGAAFGVECQVIGQPTGQHGNTLFFLADYAGRQMYVPDAYSDSPHLAGQPPIVGVPMCGSSSTSTTPPPSGGTSGDAPLVWVGSPVTGTWDVPASAGGDGAAAHHWLGNANDKGDFAIDLVAGAGQPVVLYAAPQDGRTSITARVDQIGSSCAGGGGGSFVTVGLYSGSQRVGSATYAHINISPAVGAGQQIGRWGTVLGKIGTYARNTACWTGPHVHTQLFSTKHYACFNRTFALGQAIRTTNFIGFLGGNVATTARQGCA